MGVLPSEFNRTKDNVVRSKGRRRANSFFDVVLAGVTTSGSTQVTLGSINIPAQPGPYFLDFRLRLHFSQTAGTDVFETFVDLDGGASIFNARFSNVISGATLAHTFTDVIPVSNFEPRVFNVTFFRFSGTGTATTSGDGRFARGKVFIWPQ